ncbi:hypothetical protein C8D93_101610 [Sinimarinibacterium flocculans]|uniref:Uncharacterized protein n=1 Tax=Sinimarinibacterium flocculans TaxID=985250 RepID=A0A318EH53_9GAMM|nr:hypothetical protein C8D93_101610 [Sinimarinibacterium flocculans]
MKGSHIIFGAGMVAGMALAGLIQLVVMGLGA